MTVVALVPARGGSERLPGKNVRVLRGHPLIGYTIAAARQAKVFDRVVVSTDSPEIADIAVAYGAEVPFLRPAEFASSDSPDIEWVRHCLAALDPDRSVIDVFAVLRPTSPFRSASTIRSALELHLADTRADSTRAVSRCREHPGKMWIVTGDRMKPLLDDGGADPPWHSRPYQTLPEVYVQNASLEVAWRSTVERTGTIAGTEIRPFFPPGYEGFDLNDEFDWMILERLLDAGTAELPTIEGVTQ